MERLSPRTASRREARGGGPGNVSRARCGAQGVPEMSWKRIAARARTSSDSRAGGPRAEGTAEICGAPRASRRTEESVRAPWGPMVAARRASAPAARAATRRAEAFGEREERYVRSEARKGERRTMDESAVVRTSVRVRTWGEGGMADHLSRVERRVRDARGEVGVRRFATRLPVTRVVFGPRTRTSLRETGRPSWVLPSIEEATTGVGGMAGTKECGNGRKWSGWENERRGKNRGVRVRRDRREEESGRGCR